MFSAELSRGAEIPHFLGEEGESIEAVSGSAVFAQWLSHL